MRGRQRRMERGCGRRDNSETTGIEPIEKLEGDRLLLRVNKAIYSHEALLAAGYKFNGTCYIHVDALDSDYYGVFFTAKDTGIDLFFQVNNFCNELMDQQIRFNLNKSNRSIKELIVRKAFFPFENNE
jgi:His-Xaa-Ser system protein HxsD